MVEISIATNHVLATGYAVSPKRESSITTAAETSNTTFLNCPFQTLLLSFIGHSSD
jgi:hypothetical protein